MGFTVFVPRSKKFRTSGKKIGTTGSITISVGNAPATGDLTWDSVADATGYDIGWDTVSHAAGDQWNVDEYPNIIDAGNATSYGTVVAGRYYGIRSYISTEKGPWLTTGSVENGDLAIFEVAT
jgi:hypothetical protein